MKSKISFCNGTVIRKDITRFWPLWTVLFVLLQICGTFPMISSTLTLQREKDFHHIKENMISYICGVCNPVILAAVAVIVVIFVFRYLNQKRSAYMLHSLPIKRGTLFVSHYLSGIIMVVVPYVITYLFMWLYGLTQGYNVFPVAFAFLQEMAIMLLFFYSLACLVVMVSGSSIMTLLIYGVANILVYGFTCLLSASASVSVAGDTGYVLSRSSYYVNYGVEGVDHLVEYFTPLLYFLNCLEDFLSGDKVTAFPGGMLLGSAVYLVPALLFAGLAYLLYQKRKIERVGDTLAFAWCKPVFRIVFCACGSLLFFMLVGLLGNEVWESAFNYRQIYYFMLIIVVIGCVLSYIISDMVLSRSFFVWKKLSFVQIGCLCIGMVLLLACSRWEIAQKSIPAADKVSYVTVHVMGEQRSQVGRIYLEKEAIEDWRDIQKEVISASEKEKIYSYHDDLYTCIDFTYYRGSEVYASRNYTINNEGNDKLIQKINTLFNRKENMAEQIFSPKYRTLDCELLQFLSYWGEDEEEEERLDHVFQRLSAAQREEIYLALLQDMEEGNVDLTTDTESGTWYSLIFTMEYNRQEDEKNYDNYIRSFEVELTITEKCRHTMEIIQKYI